jgi:hypothetical protein
MTPSEEMVEHRFREKFPVWACLIPRRLVMWLIRASGVDAAEYAAEQEAARHACVVCGNPCAPTREIGCVPGDCAYVDDRPDCTATEHQPYCRHYKPKEPTT